MLVYFFLCGLLGSTGFVRVFLCTPCICGKPAEAQPRPDARVVSTTVESYDGTCGGRRSLLLLLFRSDLSSALNVTQRHTHTKNKKKTA